MSEASELLDAGMQLQEEVTGHQTFIYRGRHWPCQFARSKQTNILETGGLMPDCEAVLIVRRSALKPIRTADMNELWGADSVDVTADQDIMPPRVGKEVRGPDGLIYRIKEVEPSLASWTCRLQNAAQ